MSRNIKLLYLHNLLTDFRFQAPFAIIYFQQVTGSYTAASFVLSVEVFTAALLDIPTGVFSDRIGRKYTLAIGSASYAVSLAFYAFAQNTATLVCGAMIFGLALALFSGNNNALLFETLKAEGKEKRYHHYQGRASGFFQIGLGASALAASLIAPQGLRVVFICGIIPQVLAAAVSLFFIEPRRHIEIEEKNFAYMKAAVRQVMQNRRLRLLTAAQSIGNGFGEASFMFSNAFVNGLWPIWAVAIYRALAHSFAFIGFWFSGRILDRVKSSAMLVISSAYGLATGLLAVFTANALSPLIFVTGSAFYAPQTVACENLLQKEFTDRQRATLSSVVSFTGRLVSGIAGLLLGVIADHFGLVAALTCGILASGTALPVYVRLFRKHF